MKQFYKIIAVSQLETIASVLILNLLLLYVIFAVLNHDGYMAKYLSTLQADLPLMGQYHALSSQINASDQAGDVAIFAFWGAAGLLVYYAVYYLFVSEHEAVDFFRAVMKRNDREKVSILEYEFVAVGIRVGALIGMLMVLVFFQRVIFPYEVVVWNISQQTSIFDRLIELGVAILMLLVSLHVFVVLTRAVLLRDRIFF